MNIVYAHPWLTTLWLIIIFGCISEIGKTRKND